MKHTPSHQLKLKAFRTRHLSHLIHFGAILCASVNLTSGATVSIGVDHWYFGEPGMPMPNNADLVNAGSPDLLFFNSTSFDAPTAAYDGDIAASMIDESVDEFPALTTFYLDTIDNPLGYTISSVRTLSLGVTALPGIYDTRMQFYKLEYRIVGETDFETLLTVDIRDFDPVGFDINEGWTWVTLLDIEDELTGVDALKFTWMDPSAITNSGTLIGEIDILGTPVTQAPEPGSGILLLGAAGLLWRRTRSR